MRRCGSMVLDRLVSHLPARARRLILAGIEVAVEAGEIARGDLDADAMARPEHVARRPAIDRERGHRARGEERGSLARGPVARANDPVGEVLRVAFRVDVDE